MRRLAVILISALIMAASLVVVANADGDGPVVIKNGDSGTVNPEQEDTRDRSLQDGSLIYGMTPVYPEDFREGTYDVEVLSSSQFFKITKASLTNSGGKIDAVIRISSTSYSYVYPGTAAEAAAADRSTWIPADESSGYGEFKVEVQALDRELPCAAFSKKKQKWYDRDIVFLAESLPEDVLFIELSDEGGTITDTQEAAVKVIYIALGIIIAGGILNHFVKKRFYE